MQLTPDRLKTLLVVMTSAIAIGGLSTATTLAVPATAPTEQQDNNSEGNSENSCFAEAAAYENASVQANNASREYLNATLLRTSAYNAYTRALDSGGYSRWRLMRLRAAYNATYEPAVAALVRWQAALQAESAAQTAYYRCMGW